MSHHTRVSLTMQTPSGRGRTTPSTGKTSYTSGTSVRISARPTPPYRFSHWIIDNINMKENPYVITMSVNHVVKAVFVKGYTLDVTIEPAGAGTVTKSPDKPLYEAGEVVTLTAVPATGQIFKGWTDNTVAKPAVPLVITV